MNLSEQECSCHLHLLKLNDRFTWGALELPLIRFVLVFSRSEDDFGLHALTFRHFV